MDMATQANESCTSTTEMGTQTLAEGFCLENKRRLSSPKEVQAESKRRKPSEEAEETEDDDEIPAAEQLEVATQEVADTQKKDDSATAAESPKVEAAEGLVTDPNEEVDDLEVADEVSGDEVVEEESEVEFEYEDIGEVAEEEEGEESVASADDAENADQAPAEAVEHAENPEQARERRIQQLTNDLKSAKQEHNDLKFMLDQLEGQLGPARLLRRSDIDPQNTSKIVCVFCHAVRAHYSDSCPVISDAQSRITSLIEQGRCFRCLFEACRGNQHCKRKNEACFYCREKGHHPAICTRPDEQQKLRSTMETLRRKIEQANDRIIRRHRRLDNFLQQEA
ncbi:unnamed protein product [Nippostrongylus brasiliensis]|uniref:CCHC-type domain-containing protein n=1 Tax=Nippostrongylus brasiliensis TaxID=27835 RepID=A0A0N4XI29_NIPBR|nr:unnamed protein product [Nippostrongylus brasiliensis]